MQDSKKDTDVYSGLLDSEGEGEGGMIWENGIETCILKKKKKDTIWVISFSHFSEDVYLNNLHCVPPHIEIWEGMNHSSCHARVMTRH